MKIKSFKIQNHYLFKDTEINFSNVNDEILKTIVLAGINGSGKTTLIKLIYNVLLSEINGQDSQIMLSVDEEETELIKRTLGITIENNQYFNIAKSEKSIFPPFDWRKEEKDIPRIVFLPTEINFSNLEVKTRNYKPEEN